MGSLPSGPHLTHTPETSLNRRGRVLGEGLRPRFSLADRVLRLPCLARRGAEMSGLALRPNAQLSSQKRQPRGRIDEDTWRLSAESEVCRAISPQPVEQKDLDRGRPWRFAGGNLPGATPPLCRLTTTVEYDGGFREPAECRLDEHELESVRRRWCRGSHPHSLRRTAWPPCAPSAGFASLA